MSVPNETIDLPEQQYLNKGNRRPKSERIVLIRQDVEGVPSVALIAQIEGLTPVRQYASEGGVILPKTSARGRYTKGEKEFVFSQRAERINQAIAKGVHSLEKLCRTADLTPSGFRKFCDAYPLNLPSNLKPYRYRPEMDAVIDRGETLEEIGIAGGYTGKATKENGRQYVRFSGQYDIWLKNREKAKQQARLGLVSQLIYQDLVSALESKVSQLKENSSWAEQMALRYIQSIRHINSLKIPHGKLVRLFERYGKAQNKGRQSSLSRLGKPIKVHAAYVGFILKKIGLKPMYGNIQTPRYSKRTQESIMEASRFKISGPDISYFLGIHKNYSQVYGLKIGKRFRPHAYLARIGLNHLTYRLASQIYEGQDIGFKPNEIAELLDTNEKVVAYAVDNRSALAPKIVNILRVLYPTEDFRKPYKQTQRS